MVLELGRSDEGLSDSAWQQGDMNVSIGGTGKVESLNVSVATCILWAGRLVAVKTRLNIRRLAATV
jgi:TrmH RNA methyltransferase